jgi:hypothetical protein
MRVVEAGKQGQERRPAMHAPAPVLFSFPRFFFSFYVLGAGFLDARSFRDNRRGKKIVYCFGKKGRQASACVACVCMWTDIPSRSCALAVEQITGLPTHVFPWEIS